MEQEKRKPLPLQNRLARDRQAHEMQIPNRQKTGKPTRIPSSMRERQNTDAKAASLLEHSSDKKSSNVRSRKKSDSGSNFRLKHSDKHAAQKSRTQLHPEERISEYSDKRAVKKKNSKPRSSKKTDYNTSSSAKGSNNVMGRAISGMAKGFGYTLKRTFQILFLLIFLMIAVVGIWFYAKYGKLLLSYQSKANALVARSTEETFRASETSLVYAANGELISKLRGAKDSYYLTYENIPRYAIQAMVCTEDRKFFAHDGIDLFANIRAAIVLIKNKGEIHQGGSTITQQLARNIFLTNEVTWERKITEIFVAMALERKYKKDQIMEFYLNNIYFANGHYGIQAASLGYFGKSVQDLSLSQIAFLCAIPNNPTDYDPLVNFHYTMKRRDKVLLQMRDEGVISSLEYENAVAEEINLNLSQMKRQNYVESYTYYCAIRALMRQEGFIFRNQFADADDKANYTELYNEAYYRIQKTLFTGGYRIYTSIDLEKQAWLQQAVDEELAGFTETNEEGTYKMQASAVCIDNETGMVAAITGGRSQETEGYTLNRAYQSFRQPGSAIKPLIVYTPMFERGLYPDDTVIDEKFEGGPRNSGLVYSGEIPVTYAVAVSKNTVAWKLFEELTPTVGLSYLLNMGFKKIVPTDYVPAASLGGFTYGVSSVELASGYAALANDGVFREPTCIVRITDAMGNILAGHSAAPKKIYATNAARMMTYCLEGVMREGTGRRLALDHQIAAGKTGTTNDQKDGWFAGYTKYYTTAVWVGCDMPKAMDDLKGSSYPGRIWHNFMNRAHQGLTAKEFLMYTDSRPPKIEESDEDNQENSDDTVQEDTNSDQSDNTSDNISQSPFDPPTAPTDLPEGF